MDIKKVIKEIKQGRSLRDTALYLGHDIKNMRAQLRKLYPEIYEKHILGEIIEKWNGYTLRKIPHNQTSKTQSRITKDAKTIYKWRGYIEEVGVYVDNKRYVIDLWHPILKEGVELHWKGGSTKELIKRAKIYKEIFRNIRVGLIFNSDAYKPKTWVGVKQRLRENKIRYYLIDIAKLPPTKCLSTVSDGTEKNE